MLLKMNPIGVLTLVSWTFVLSHASESSIDVNYSLRKNEPKEVIVFQDNKEENEKNKDAKDESALPFLSAFAVGSSTQQDFKKDKGDKVGSDEYNDEKFAFLFSLKASEENSQKKNSNGEKDKNVENEDEVELDGGEYSDVKLNDKDDKQKPALPSIFHALVSSYKKEDSEQNEDDEDKNIENYHVIDRKEDDISQTDYLLDEDSDGDDEEDGEGEVLINYGNDFRQWFYYPSIFNFKSHAISIRRPIYRPYQSFRYPLIYSQYINPYKLYGYRNRYLDMYKNMGFFDDVYDGDMYF